MSVNVEQRAAASPSLIRRGKAEQASLDPHLLERLEQRLGRAFSRQRLAVERDHEAQVFGQGINFFHIENLTPSHALIRALLKLAGLYARGLRNAARVEVRHHRIVSPRIPAAFDGFIIAQLSDLHVDMSAEAMDEAAKLLGSVEYDLCILTGDYRGKTFGPSGATIAGMKRLRPAIKSPVYAVLGNHDSILMLPELEAMDILVLMNERVTIAREGEEIHLAGIDDAHFYRTHDLEAAKRGIPPDAFSIIVSHTPEIYREAAEAGFDFMLSGHTHGGQICLPGGIPLTLDSVLPRAFGAGAWRYRQLAGYTSAGTGSSVVPVRFNCPPEITLHHFDRG